MALRLAGKTLLPPHNGTQRLHPFQPWQSLAKYQNKENSINSINSKIPNPQLNCTRHAPSIKIGPIELRANLEPVSRSHVMSPAKNPFSCACLWVLIIWLQRNGKNQCCPLWEQFCGFSISSFKFNGAQDRQIHPIHTHTQGELNQKQHGFYAVPQINGVIDFCSLTVSLCSTNIYNYFT